ncbi:hypothetical protein AGABI1DRAFT_37131 [Agaricus bisporus var. burnettii JB137-S8]|uniref:NADP-dependent oxidoreductase domain-containing protein n=1 Tax=Agaricus bisporus var. burnettii (strain JB137-S8 / ATCC MYA-4627 / FGSC 10392) TaxID=597362 RepID=K5XC46_AGABU|nr:uncharacterized protein AGABI1DRAFT_37131 [Agaricus bisporus var. burnettii JB137-S8]EKM80657.1 hypothetical protein AGABI1DRAFT_37131 [Agaricus bisporus var. burnettii JB137-S8]
MPVIGLGVYRNYTTRDSVFEALRAGYRLVDTAQAYKNEAHVGQGLRNEGISRSDVFITTKIISKFHGYPSTMQAVDESLERFQFQYIDLYLIHDPYAGTKRRLATYKALQDAKAAGKIRSVGVSNYGIQHLEEIRNAGYEMPAVNQIELHPHCQQRPLVAYCREHEIVVQAYSPLLQGKMDDPVFSEIAEKHGRDPAQILIRWSLQKGFVPLPKSARPERIRSNLDVFDFELDDRDMLKLDSLNRGKEGAVTWNPVDAG